MEHDLFRKPVSTFRNHALAAGFRPAKDHFNRRHERRATLFEPAGPRLLAVAQDTQIAPRSAPDARRAARRDALGLDALRPVPAQGAVRLRGRRDPLGRKRNQRQASAMRALHRMRPQRRDTATSGMGRRQHRLSAVSGVCPSARMNLLCG
jgi:hypothetical protein